MPPRRFRINAKNYFLTYPNCSVSKDDALEYLSKLAFPTSLKFIKVCRELHTTGEPHLHVLLQFEGKFCCTNNRFFDIEVPNRRCTFHPNIQAATNAENVKEYIEKEGDTCEWGQFQTYGCSRSAYKQSANEVYAEALRTGSRDEALQVIKQKDPKTFTLQYHNLTSNYDRIFQPPIAPFVSRYLPDSFIISANLQEWVRENISLDNTSAARPERPISIIIEGPSRIGKTAWARSLGPHNYLSGHLDFNKFVYSNAACYNVIDDVSPQYLKLKHWKELIGAQKDWQTNCKYGKPVQIKGGIPAIVLCNPGDGSSYKDFLEKSENAALRDWTLKNAKFEFIDAELFTTSSS